jgi:hypothetical protein
MDDGTEAAANRFSHHSSFTCYHCMSECLEFPLEGKRNRKVQPNGDADTDPDPGSDRKRHPNANADLNIDGHAYGHSHGHGDTDLGLDAGSRLLNQLAWQ